VKKPSLHQSLFVPRSQSHTASFVALASVRNRLPVHNPLRNDSRARQFRKSLLH